MKAGRFSQSLQAASIQPDAIRIKADMAAFGAGEIDYSVRFVHAVQLLRFPLARSHRANRLAIGRVMIDVLPSVARTQPQERTILQPERQAHILRFNPSAIAAAIAESGFDLARFRIGEVKLQFAWPSVVSERSRRVAISTT